MRDLAVRTATQSDAAVVADLIRRSTNAWYEAHGLPAIFQGASDATRIFWETYDAIDPDCCLLACDPKTGEIAGSCFYHRRPTHLSLGIMNVDPTYFGRSVASRLLDRICRLADDAGLPLRLVSSAMNLDSFSLYTRRGFVPRVLYQDMVVPDTAAIPDRLAPELRDIVHRVRAARPSDLDSIVALGVAIERLDRRVDFAHFLENANGCWRLSVLDGGTGLEGCVASIAHEGSTMIGPGYAKTEAAAAALLASELRAREGVTPVFLVPAHCERLVGWLYQIGARNVELHVHQCRGAWQEANGVSLPSFLPESA